MPQIKVYLRGAPLYSSNDQSFFRYSTDGVNCEFPIQIFAFKNGPVVGKALSAKAVSVGGIECLEFECQISHRYITRLDGSGRDVWFSGASAVGWKGLHIRQLFLSDANVEFQAEGN